MRNRFMQQNPNPSTICADVIRPILTGLLIGAVLVGLFFGGKAAGRNEILSSDMWTDCCGTIYIDCLPEVVAHENLTIVVSQRINNK